MANTKNIPRRREDDGSDKPQVPNNERRGRASTESSVPMVEDKVLASLIRKAWKITNEQGDDRRLSSKGLEDLEALRKEVRSLDYPLQQKYLRHVQNFGLIKGMYFPTKDGGTKNFAENVMWALFPWNAPFFSAWTRLVAFTGQAGLRPDLYGRIQMVAAANEALGNIEYKQTLQRESDMEGDDFLKRLVDQSEAGRDYNHIMSDVELVQESIDRITRNQQRRRAGQEVNEEANQVFSGAEEQEEQVTPESLREEAEKKQAEAKEAGNAGKFEKAGACQKAGKRLLAKADELEKELAEAQKEVIAEEAHAESLKITTGASIEDEEGQESPTSLKKRGGVEVKEISVETPESLEAEATELDAEETKAAGAKDYSGALSFETQAKNKRERAAHLRAAAERKKAAENEQPKPAEAQPSGQTNGATEESEPEEVAAPATEGQADPGSNNEDLKLLAKRFARSEIDDAEYKEMKALLS